MTENYTEIRPVRPGDEAELTAMIHELAEFERASPKSASASGLPVVNAEP